MQTLNEYFDENVEPFELDEKFRDVRVREGKKETRLVTDKPGYKMDHGREVRMSPTEKLNREHAQKLAQRKRDAKMRQTQKKIEKSKHKAESLGLDIGRPKD